MKRQVAAFIAVFLLANSCAPVFAGEPTSQAVAASPFTADAYLAHVKYLASDELGGRRPGDPGIELAAEYIARQFAAAGLQPAGDDDTWYQEFHVRRGKKIVDDEALLKIKELEGTWRLRADWIPLPFSGMAEVEGPLAFAGYGIQSKDYEYDDFDKLDVEGKILLIFRYEPLADSPDAPFGGVTPSRHSLFSRKARLASRLGAKALLIVNPPLRDSVPAGLYEFAEKYTQRTMPLPVVHVSPGLAEALLEQTGQPNLETLQTRLDAREGPLSADLNLTIHLKPGVQPNLVPTRNVLGLLAGNGDTAETIVIGAHYDHLGRVRRQFQYKDRTPRIHNGADDNASGTAAVIELARVLGQERNLRRNVLFMAFSAEEMGLLGSKHFVNHPTVPLEDVRAMVNFDMVGRLSQDKLAIYGIPSAAEFSDLVSQAAAGLDINYRAARSITGNSDHASFYDYEIPFLFPITGVHKQYHQPEDDWELIDAPGAARLLAMFHPVVRDLANMEAGPTFQGVDTRPEPEDLEMKPAVEHEKDALDGGEVERPTRPTVRFGLVPDLAGTDQPGMVVDSVIDGGPAKAAGLQAGDRIVRIAEHEITDIYAYMSVLRDFKPGDQLAVVVMRDGQEHTLQVHLQGEPQPPAEH